MRLEQAHHRAVRGPVVLAVMDGVGLGPGDAGDAVAHADAPFLHALPQQRLYWPLRAHGRAVGLADDHEMGNSEVGHNAMGAGQIVAQGAARVADAVRTGAIFHTEVWRQIVAQLHAKKSALHLIGLLSDGNVHSHIDHALALLHAAMGQGTARVYVHVLLDGRDVPRQSALVYLERLEAELQKARARGHDARIVSGGGRMQITMDRYGADWPMVERGWRCHVHAEGPRATSAQQAVQAARAQHPNVSDQELPAFVVADGQRPPAPIVDDDVVIAFNFRGDRMLQLTEAFGNPAFDAFDRGRVPKVLFVGMTQYDGDTKRPRHYLVEPPRIEHTLGEALSQSGIVQLAVSETQKFGHVTYFWNGNRSGPFNEALEHSVHIPSAHTPFAKQPAMQAASIAEQTLLGLARTGAQFARLNFPNGDMVGHTGDFAATVLAIEAVDRAVARLHRGVVDQLGGALLVTADHGNAEQMLERQSNGALARDAKGHYVPKPSHSCSLVPCAIFLPPADAPRCQRAPAGVEAPGLANLAATCATLLGLRPHAVWRPSLVAVGPS